MNKRSKTIAKLGAIIAVLALLVVRGYREIVPSGAKSAAYLIGRVEGGTIVSPAGSEYSVQFNDAGAAHSGNHWTWVVGYRRLTGYFVKTEGYLGSEYAVDGKQIPIGWDGELPLLPFRNGRYK